jgi:hypothetical protein
MMISTLTARSRRTLVVTPRNQSPLESLDNSESDDDLDADSEAVIGETVAGIGDKSDGLSCEKLATA